MSDIAERVAAGAAWLDEQRPGWANEIDLAKLRMQSACRCILGQLFGHYAHAPLSLADAQAYGFYVDSPLVGLAGGPSVERRMFAEYMELEEAWERTVLAARTGSGVAMRLFLVEAADLEFVVFD